jgi:hypothetical protein
VALAVVGSSVAVSPAAEASSRPYVTPQAVERAFRGAILDGWDSELHSHVHMRVRDAYCEGRGPWRFAGRGRQRIATYSRFYCLVDNPSINEAISVLTIAAPMGQVSLPWKFAPYIQ